MGIEETAVSRTNRRWENNVLLLSNCRKRSFPFRKSGRPEQILVLLMDE
jgi:hypothetical protein